MFNASTCAYVSPLDRWFSRPGVISHHGQEMAEKCHQVAESLLHLDPEHDEQVPEWAQKLLTCKFISSVGKYVIMKEHIRDISLIRNAKSNAAAKLAHEKKAAFYRGEVDAELKKVQDNPSEGFEKENNQ